MGMKYGSIAVKREEDHLALVFTSCENADQGGIEVEKELVKLDGEEVYFRMVLDEEGTCTFSYSLDGHAFEEAGTVMAKEGKWIGAKIGFFITSDIKINDSAYMDIDWFRINR